MRYICHINLAPSPRVQCNKLALWFWNFDFLLLHPERWYSARTVSFGFLRMNRKFWEFCASHVKAHYDYSICRTALFKPALGVRARTHLQTRSFALSSRCNKMLHEGAGYGHYPILSSNFCPKNSRNISWSFKSQNRNPEFPDVPDNEEDVARAAIMDKVMKGRQPAELMLRCKLMKIYYKLQAFH